MKKYKIYDLYDYQVRDLVADVLTELVIELEDPSLAIASELAMKLLAKKLK